MKLLRSILVLGLTIAVAACNDDPTGPEGDPDGGREILAQPSFATNINEIFQRRGCASGNCHGVAGGRAGLELTGDAAANYAQLVDVDATSESFKLVLPGDAQNSYLVIKLEGRQTVGQRMPSGGGAALDNIDLTNIRNWIDNGAPNN